MLTARSSRRSALGRSPWRRDNTPAPHEATIRLPECSTASAIRRPSSPEGLPSTNRPSSRPSRRSSPSTWVKISSNVMRDPPPQAGSEKTGTRYVASQVLSRERGQESTRRHYGIRRVVFLLQYPY